MTPLLTARALRVSFEVGRWPQRRSLDALAGVDVAVRGGCVLGVVGESGSGKTTLLRVLAGLTAPTAGSVELDGTPVWRLSPRARRALLATSVGMVWQDPTSSMNPRLPVSAIVEDPLRIHRRGDGAARSARVAELLDLVRIPADLRGRRVHELSGGQRQRVAVARALALQPRFVLADEPASALDVSLRGELLDLLAHVRDELAVGIVLVSHDIQATRYLADDVLVMYRGDIVERGAVHDVVDRPAHAYSQRLLASVSTLSGHRPGGHA